VKVYVAGSSKELARASSIMTQIRMCPELELTMDWVAQIREVGVANPADAPEGLRRSWAMNAIQAVQDAPVLWLLLPTTETVGAWCELSAAVVFGMTQPLRRRIMTSGPPEARARSIFTALADRHFDTDGEALADLRMYARG